MILPTVAIIINPTHDPPRAASHRFRDRFAPWDTFDRWSATVVRNRGLDRGSSSLVILPVRAPMLRANAFRTIPTVYPHAPGGVWVRLSTSEQKYRSGSRVVSSMHFGD